MSEFQVDAATLRTEGSAVSQVTSALDSARLAVVAAGAASGSAGHDLVAEGLRAYTTWWSQALGGLTSGAGVIADQLVATADDYAATDDRVRGALSATGSALPAPGASAPGTLGTRLGGPV